MYVNKRRMIGWAGAMALCAVAASGATLWLVNGPFASKAALASNATTTSVMHTEVSWAMSYNNIPAMAQASTAVVVGKVANGLQSTNSQNITQTAWTINVEKTLKGTPSPGDAITVTQPG